MKHRFETLFFALFDLQNKTAVIFDLWASLGYGILRSAALALCLPSSVSIDYRVKHESI